MLPHSRRLIVLIPVCIFALLVQAQTAPRPITDHELIALVAGNAISENVVREINTRGIAFRPTDTLRAQLSEAGADAVVLKALETAKLGEVEPQSDASVELVRHLAAAGKLIRNKQDRDAARELSVAAKASPFAPEPGFVMGEVLRRNNQWEYAEGLYLEVLKQDPAFPEARTKLSYVYYRLGSPPDAMREANLELKKDPKNAEAHKNLGLALWTLKNYDSAIHEYEEALRIKPGYAAVHRNLALVYTDRGDTEKSIKEYERYHALEPGDAITHYDLGVMLGETKRSEAAIREYREAKRIDPSFPEPRLNLGVELRKSSPEAALREFRELLAMAPDYQPGYVSLGITLLEMGDPTGAETAFRRAILLDPSEGNAPTQLGVALEKQGKYDDALAAYQHALQVDRMMTDALAGRGRIFLFRKNYVQAVAELRQAVSLRPDIPEYSELLGKALALTGDSDGAIASYQASLRAFPYNVSLRLRLARALEKKHDIAGAVKEYQQVAAETNEDSARAECAEALKRLGTTSAGAQTTRPKNDDLQKQLEEATRGKDTETAWQGAMGIGRAALGHGQLADAERAYLVALPLAEKLSPKDQRLLDTLSQLTVAYGGQRKFAEAQALLERGLVLAQELFGPGSSEVGTHLDALGETAIERKDYATARSYLFRALEIREQILGPKHTMVAMTLFRLAQTYQSEQAYDKAEPLALRAMKINEELGGAAWNLKQLVALYVAWGKLDKAEANCRQLVTESERDYGMDSPMMVASLQSLEDVLTKEGKTEEASLVRNRREMIAGDQPGAK